MEYDTLNKASHPYSSQSQASYNFWKEIPIARYIGRYLSTLTEKVELKRQNPEQPINFSSGFYRDNFMRFKLEWELAFDEAQPQNSDPNAVGEINALLDNANQLDGRIEQLKYRDDLILTVVRDLFDCKVRDYNDVFVTKDANDPYVKKCFIEPETYPNYFIHWSEIYPTGSNVTRTGTWMPEHDYMPMVYYDKDEVKLLETEYTQEKLILGLKEYGLIPTFNIETETRTSQGNISSPTIWTFIEEIPPNTPGIPNNPLRLEHLRKPLTGNSKHVSHLYETYQEVIERYKFFYY